MNRLLQALGLMRVSEHERIVGKSFDEVRALCSHLWARHYRDKVPNWLPLDTLPGVISQLDNMTAGVSNDIDEMTAKFKEAITDLAAARDKNRVLNVELAKAGNLRGELKARAEKAEDLLERALAREADLTPDAEAMRRKRQMDRDRRKGKVS